MTKKFIFLSFVSAFLLTLSHCTKKEAPIPQEENSTVTREEDVDLKKIEKSTEAADLEINKMMDELSNMGYQDRNQMAQLLNKFNATEDKFEKYKLCSPILMARVSYQLREKVNKDVPKLSPDQLATIDKAEAHCKWASNVVNEFEGQLSDEDFKTIASDVPDSMVPIRKSVFSTGKKCTRNEFGKLLTLNRELYTETKVLGAVLIMVAIQVDGNIKQYIPNYRKVLNNSQFSEKDFLNKLLDQAAEAKPQARAIEQKKDSLLNATKALSEAGVKSIPQFLVQSVSAAPNCFSSVQSGVVDIAKLVSTSDRMKDLYERLYSEVKKTGKLPSTNPIKDNQALKNLDTNFLDQMVKEKVATRDKWFRPLMISGDKNSFKVVSAGKDRVPGTDDDISYPNY